jgi:hypothetical protein
MKTKWYQKLKLLSEELPGLALRLIGGKRKKTCIATVPG